MTATITFRTKVEDCQNADGSLAYRFVKVPEFTRKHCDMNSFRCHSKYGSYANSDMFHGMLKTIRKPLLSAFDYRTGSGFMRLDQVPPNVKVDDSGFLAVVTVEV